MEGEGGLEIAVSSARPRRRRWVATALVALLPLTVTATAIAATGDLTSLGCVQDNDFGGENCGRATDGLTAAASVAVSPEGNSVYVASRNDDAIVHLARDPATGVLAPVGCIDDDDVGDGPDNCTASTDGLDQATDVAVSPDGKSVYAAGFGDDAIVRFDREPATGALTPKGCLDDNDAGSGPEASCSDTNGLNGASSVTVSPDGTSIYATSLNDNAIVRIDRDTNTGAFADNACIDDDDPGQSPDDCGPGNTTDGLDGAVDAVVSPDGRSVYVASLDDDAIVSFDRGAATGALAPVGCIDDHDFMVDPTQGPDSCGQSTAALAAAVAIAVSPDGRSVYAASLLDDALLHFDRDMETGGLAPGGCIDDNDSPQGPDECAQSTDGLNGAFSVAISPDAASVYAAGSEDDAVVLAERDSGTGALAPRGCIDDNDSGPDACAQEADGVRGAFSVAASPDARSIYVVGNGDSAVAAFDRDLGEEGPDTDPPETTIVKGPKRKTKKRKAKFTFASDEPGSTFQCKLDKKDFEPCDASEKLRVKRGKHKLQARAVDPTGNTDPTPAKRKWKVKKKRKKK